MISSYPNTSATSFLLEWKPPEDVHQNGIILGYTVIVELASNGTRIEIVNTSLTMLDVNNLMPLTVYVCKLAAYTSAGSGPFAKSPNIRTDKEEQKGKHKSIRMNNINYPLVSLIFM